MPKIQSYMLNCSYLRRCYNQKVTSNRLWLGTKLTVFIVTTDLKLPALVVLPERVAKINHDIIFMTFESNVEVKAAVVTSYLTGVAHHPELKHTQVKISTFNTHIWKAIMWNYRHFRIIVYILRKYRSPTTQKEREIGNRKCFFFNLNVIVFHFHIHKKWHSIDNFFSKLSISFFPVLYP